jgi:hypothetical protein
MRNCIGRKCVRFDIISVKIVIYTKIPNKKYNQNVKTQNAYIIWFCHFDHLRIILGPIDRVLGQVLQRKRVLNRMNGITNGQYKWIQQGFLDK